MDQASEFMFISAMRGQSSAIEAEEVRSLEFLVVSFIKDK